MAWSKKRQMVGCATLWIVLPEAAEGVRQDDAGLPEWTLPNGGLAVSLAVPALNLAYCVTGPRA